MDGDLRNPCVHRLFGLPQEPGFIELLRSEARLEEAIRPTCVEGLWILTSGQYKSGAAQELSQDRCRDLFRQFGEQYDCVVLDSPPVLPVVDPLVLGRYVDGVILSVLHNVSQLPLVSALRGNGSPCSISTSWAPL